MKRGVGLRHSKSFSVRLTGPSTGILSSSPETSPSSSGTNMTKDGCSALSALRRFSSRATSASNSFILARWTSRSTSTSYILWAFFVGDFAQLRCCELTLRRRGRWSRAHVGRGVIEVRQWWGLRRNWLPTCGLAVAELRYNPALSHFVATQQVCLDDKRLDVGRRSNAEISAPGRRCCPSCQVAICNRTRGFICSMTVADHSTLTRTGLS